MATLDRLREFHAYLKDNGYGGRNVFEREIGVSEGYLSQSKRKGINSDVLEKVAECYPQLSMDWLVSGIGSMLIDSSATEAEETANDEIIKLHRELEEAYKEIGRLSMELKSAQQHNLTQKIG